MQIIRGYWTIPDNDAKEEEFGYTDEFKGYTLDYVQVYVTKHTIGAGGKVQLFVNTGQNPLSSNKSLLHIGWGAATAVGITDNYEIIRPNMKVGSGILKIRATADLVGANTIIGFVIKLIK